MKKFFRGILLIINLVFVVLMILSTLSGTMSPEKHPNIAVLSYVCFPLMLCNVVFVIIWLCMGRWEAVVSAAAIVLRFSFWGLFFQVGGTTDVEPTEDSLRVLTFNTHSFRGRDCDEDESAGAESFYKLLDEEQPDVICMQEFFGPRSFRDSVEARGYRYHFGCNGKRKHSQAIIFSKYPFVSVRNYEGETKFFVEVEKEGYVVRVCCVHLGSYQMDGVDLSGLDDMSKVERDSTVDRVLGKLKATSIRHEQEWKEDVLPMLENCEVPVILAGDFNDTPASYIYHQVTERLTDSYVEQGRGFCTTYHGPYPAFRIDYIFHSPELQTLSYKRIKTSVSDHYPIVVQVGLRRN